MQLQPSHLETWYLIVFNITIAFIWSFSYKTTSETWVFLYTVQKIIFKKKIFPEFLSRFQQKHPKILKLR